MIQTLSDALKAKFTAMVGTGKPFVAVYDWHTEKSIGFPFLCFEMTDFSAEILDSCNNQRTYTFTVFIMQDIKEPTGTSRGDAVKILEKAMDDVIDSLDTDFTLGGLAKMVRPTGGRIEPLILESGKAMVATLIVDVETIAFIR